MSVLPVLLALCTLTFLLIDKILNEIKVNQSRLKLSLKSIKEEEKFKNLIKNVNDQSVNNRINIIKYKLNKLLYLLNYHDSTNQCRKCRVYI